MTELVQEIGIISLLSLLSALVTSILGFGAGLVLTPLLTFIMPLKEALGVGTLVYLVTSASKTYWFRSDIDRSLWRKSLPFSLVGLALGMLAVTFTPEHTLGLLFAGVLIYFSLNAIFGKDDSPSLLPQPLYPLLGAIASVMVHAAGVFYFRYCRMNGLDRMQTVATMAALHFTLNIAKVIFFTSGGLVDLHYTYYLIPAYLCAVLGTRLGRSILKGYVSERMFTLGVSSMLILLAFRMVWQAI